MIRLITIVLLGSSLAVFSTACGEADGPARSQDGKAGTSKAHDGSASTDPTPGQSAGPHGAVAEGGGVPGGADEPVDDGGSPATADPRPAAPSTWVDVSAFRDPSLFPTPAIAVYQFLKMHGDHAASLFRIRQTVRGDSNGIGFAHLTGFLSRRNVTSSASRVGLEALHERGVPAVILLRSESTRRRPEQGYFAACRPAGDGFRLIDPMLGVSDTTVDALAKRYLGAALVADPAPKFGTAVGPDLVCEEVVYGYEQIATGDEIRHNFRIRNAGTKPLKITNVLTTCGCAAAMINKDEQLSKELIEAARKGAKKGGDDKKFIEQRGASGILEPGESAWVSSYVDTRQKQGFMSFRIRLRSNDPEEPELALSIQGNIVRVIEYDPVSIWFREVHSRKGATDYLWVRHYQAKPVKLTDFASSSRHVRVTVDENAPRRRAPRPNARPGALPRVYPKEQGWVGVRIELLPGAPIGPLSAAVRGRVDDTPVEASIAAMIKGNIQMNPPYFSFGHVVKGEPQTVQISLSSVDGEGFAIEKAVADRDFMTAEVQPTGKGTYAVKLHLKKGWTAFDLQGAVTVHSNDSLEPKKKVLVYGFIKRG